MRIINLILLLSCMALLPSCGTAVPPPSKKTNETKATTFYVDSFSPASGSLSAAPSSITVTFNLSALEENTAVAVSNYNINCGGYYIAADSVARTSGTFTSVITLPTITGLASGTVCTFIVSTNIKDANGVSLAGSNIATYIVQ